jgi:ABC-2 type transport system permease protein
MNRFLQQLGFELLKLFARKRTYIGFVFFLAIELLILTHPQVPMNRRRLERDMPLEGFDLSAYFGGLTLGFQVIAVTMFTLGSVYLALVCGDIISKEVEDGTMRMVLSRPVSRLRILVLKYLTCIAYTVLLAAFVVLTSLGLSILLKGVGTGLVVVAPWEHVTGVFSPREGLERLALGSAALTFCLLSISTLGFMFSCFNLKPATATVLTLSVYLFDDILRNLPVFSDYRNDFLTHHTAVWQHLFEMTIPWARIGQSFAYLAIFDLVALAIATFYFLRRDFKS